MLNKIKNRNKGFTIIEVLIVLAIAGLILLIVFLAVPALQRNSRNTQRKNDVAALLGAAAEFSNNNNGRMANSCTGNAVVSVTNTTTGSVAAEAKVGYYNVGCAQGDASAVGRAGIRATYANTGPYTTANQDFVTLVPAARCSTTTVGQTTAGSARQWAAVYTIENTAGTFAPVCQES